MASYVTGYQTMHPSPVSPGSAMCDPMSPVSALNRIACVSCERFILLMNNTRQLLSYHRLGSIQQVIQHLYGEHTDVGCNGDRGDFWRRKLAEQICLRFAIDGLDHTNVLHVVEGAVRLENETRQIMSVHQSGPYKPVPHVNVDDKLLNILARMADML